MAKIMIIDDDKEVRYTVTKIGNSASWEVNGAEDGPAALENIQEYQPDIVLIDYHMPRMNGKETLKKLKEAYPEGVFVILTVDERKALAEELLESGADDFVLKPVKAQDLISRLDVHLRHKELKDKVEGKDKIKLEVPDKGFVPETLSLVIEYMKDKSDFVTIKEISDEVGVAYPTAHRYLNYLKERDLVEVSYTYGYQGRPLVKYRLKRKDVIVS